MPKAKASQGPQPAAAAAAHQPKTSTRLYEATARDTVFNLGCLAKVLRRVGAGKSVTYYIMFLRFRLGPRGIERVQNMLREHRAEGCGRCLAVTLREIGE